MPQLNKKILKKNLIYATAAYEASSMIYQQLTGSS